MSEQERRDYILPADAASQAKIDTLRGVKILLTPQEIVSFIKKADRALNGDSNDAEHDALYEIREWLSDFLEDPERRDR